MRRWKPATWIMTGVTGLVGLVALFFLSPSLAVPPDPFETELYYAFEFSPSYRLEECVVALTARFSEQSEPSADSQMFNEFGRYMLEHEPKAALLNFRGTRDGKLYYFFPDQCDRRHQIIDAAIPHIMAAVPGLHIERSNEPIPSWIIDDNAGNIWIDSRDYDASYWKIHREAVGRCAPDAWMALARYRDTPEAPSDRREQAFIYYSLAQRISGSVETSDRMKSFAASLSKKSADWINKLVNTYAQRLDCAKK